MFTDSHYTFEELLQFDDEALSAVVYPQDSKSMPKKELPDFEAVENALCRGKKKEEKTDTSNCQDRKKWLTLDKEFICS